MGGAGEWIGSRNLPVWVTACYFLCSVLGYLVAYFVVEEAIPEWAKDGLHLAFTSVVIYLLLYRGVGFLRGKESALRESEDRLARILETSVGGIVVFDGNDAITFANHAAGEILGVERSGLIGLRPDDPAWEFTDADGAPMSKEDLPLERVRATRLPVYDVQFLVRHHDGPRAFLTVNAAPLLDASGDMVGTVASFTDITARKKVEDLKVRKLLLAVEQSPSAIVITDLEGNVEYANPRFASMTGSASREAVGEKMRLACEIPRAERKKMGAAIRSGTAWRGEFRCRRKNGESYWESTSATPIRTAEGETTGLLWVREDVTERRAAEEALRRSEADYRALQENFQSLVETVTDVVWEVDRNAGYTYVSPKIRDLLGYEPEEILGKTPFDLMPEQEARRVSEIFRDIAARREPFRGVENVNRHKDGRLVVIETSGAPFFGADGRFLGYRGVDRDIGERKRAEEMLRVSEERFRQIFEQNEEPLFLFRRGTCEIFDANRAAERLYGFPREELVRSGPCLFVPPGEVREFTEAIRGIRPGSGVNIEWASHLRKDGARIIVSIRGKSIRLQDGDVAYCSFRDITARVRMEEEARLHQAQLIHANRMTSLGTIVSGVAHEVNNPNNLVMFNAPMILSAWEDALPVLDAHRRENGDFPLGGLPYSEMREVVPRLAAGISEASARIKRIVGDLKDFARQETPGRVTPVRVNDVVRTAVTIINHEILRATHRFEVEYGESLPEVMGSAQRLEQVLINLLNNALQALPSSRHGVRVRTQGGPDARYVEIRVEDEGVGMSPQVLERITEPFFSTRLDSGGLGLGVSICRSIVREHQGTIAFESEEGKGTRVTLRLPALGCTMDPAAGEPASEIA